MQEDHILRDNSYLCINGVMKAFVARGVTLGLETSVQSHNTLYIQNFMSGRNFQLYNHLGRFNFKITTQKKSGRWNKPVIVITVVTASTRAAKTFIFHFTIIE
jgi:hypothetical protein